MKKEYVVGIWCIVVGVVLFVVFTMYVGKDNKVSAPPDITITNSLQLKDISENAMIHNEARRRLVELMAENNLKPDGHIDLVKVLTYNTFNGHHYLALEFKTRVVGYKDLGHAVAYLNVQEKSGQYTIVRDRFNLTIDPETDQIYKTDYAEILNDVQFCEGALPKSTEKM